MKLKIWENVIIAWVNALSLPKIHDIFELKNGNFFLDILDQLKYKIRDADYENGVSSHETHLFIVAFIKDIYPEYEAPTSLNNTEEITLAASAMLLWFCLKTQDKELLLPLYSLGHSTQCCVQAFLEKLLYIPSSSITKELIFSAISSIDESYLKESSVTSITYTSPASPSIHGIKQEFMSPGVDKNKEEIRSLQRDIDVLRSENNYLLGEVEQFKCDNEKLANEMEIKKKAILKLENELFVVSGEASFKNENEKQKFGEVFRKKELKCNVDECEKLALSLKQELTDVSDSKNKLRKKVGDLEKDNISWREKVSEMADRCSCLEAQLTHSESVISQLQQTIVLQREFLSETNYHGNITVGNDSSILCEEICSPCASENLTSVVEVKYNELEANFQSMATDLNKAKLALQDKDKRIYSLMAEINNNSNKINKLEEDLVQNKNDIILKVTRINAFDAIIDNLKDNIQQLTSEKSSVESNVQSLSDSLSIMNSENNNLVQEVNNLNCLINVNSSTLILKNEEIDQFKKTLYENENLLKTYVSALEDLRVKSSKESDELDTLKLKIDELLIENISVNMTLNNVIEEKGSLQKEFGNLKSTAVSYKEKVVNLSNEIESLSKDFKILEKENETLSSEWNSLSDSLSELNSKIFLLDAEIMECKSNLEKVMTEKAELHHHNVDLYNMNSELKTECNRINKEMKAYKNKVNELENELTVNSEEKTSLLVRLEEFDKNKLMIKTLESEILTINELMNLDKLQMKKNADEKMKIMEEMTFKKREIEGMTLQLMDFQKNQEVESLKYQELLEKCYELKQLNETLCSDLASQKRRVTELDSENLEYVYEIAHLREIGQKVESKHKEQIEMLTNDVDSLNKANNLIESEKLEVFEEKCRLEKCIKDLGSKIQLNEGEELEVQNLNSSIDKYLLYLRKIEDENVHLTEGLTYNREVIDEINQFLEMQKSILSTIELVEIERTRNESDTEITGSVNLQREVERNTTDIFQLKKKVESILNLQMCAFDEVKNSNISLKVIVDEYKLEIDNLVSKNSALSLAADNAYSELQQTLNFQISVKIKKMADYEFRIVELTSDLENEKVIVSNLKKENKQVVNENLRLLSENQQLEISLQNKICALDKLEKTISSARLTLKSKEVEFNRELEKTVSSAKLTIEFEEVEFSKELERTISSAQLIIESKEALFTQVVTEKKALEDEVNNSVHKMCDLMTEVNSLSEELSEKTTTNKKLIEEISIQKEQLSKADSKNMELSNRIETLNDSILQYCVSIQDNTTYISEVKTKMAFLRESLAKKDAELHNLNEDRTSLSSKCDQLIKIQDKLNSEIVSFIENIQDKESELKNKAKFITELECGKIDLASEKDQLYELMNAQSEELSVVTNELSATKLSLSQSHNNEKSLHNQISEKNNIINTLNFTVNGLKYGLVENSKLLKQILNETRFFGNVTMRIHGDINDSFSRLGTPLNDESDCEIIFPKEESLFDPAFVKWRDLQSEIINALKNQLDCVYSAAKEKDALCNDLNIKINDLVSEMRRESLESESYKSQVLELKEQIDELTESTEELLAKKDDAITALKEEVSFLSDSGSRDTLELRLKIEKLIEFNAELDFKLNQAQLERDFFKEESEQLITLKDEIKEKDSVVLKLEQDIEMLEHEKNILDKRVAFLTKDAEDVKSLKVELSDIKHKFSTMDSEQQCSGDVEQLTDEEKLTRIKPEFLKSDLRTCFEEAIEQIIQQCDMKLQIYKEKVIKSEGHIKELSADLWEATDKFMMANQELHTLRAELAKALNTSSRQESSFSLEGALHRLSFGCIGTGFDNLGCEELEKMDDVFPLNYQHKMIRNSKKHRRHSGVPKFSLMSGKVFPTEEEVEEIFNDNCLSNLKAGICNIPDPNVRFLSLPPTSVPLQEVDDRRLSSTKSLQGNEKHKKEVGQIVYRKPGPPTPSKNANRLSISDINSSPSTSGLREQNIITNEKTKSTVNTHTKIKSLFTARPKQLQDGVKKKTNFFRRKKERENISPS